MCRVAYILEPLPLCYSRLCQAFKSRNMRLGNADEGSCKTASHIGIHSVGSAKLSHADCLRAGSKCQAAPLRCTCAALHLTVAAGSQPSTRADPRRATSPPRQDRQKVCHPSVQTRPYVARPQDAPPPALRRHEESQERPAQVPCAPLQSALRGHAHAAHSRVRPEHGQQNRPAQDGLRLLRPL